MHAFLLPDLLEHFMRETQKNQLCLWILGSLGIDASNGCKEYWFYSGVKSIGSVGTQKNLQKLCFSCSEVWAESGVFFTWKSQKACAEII